MNTDSRHLTGRAAAPERPQLYTMHLGDAASAYEGWPAPMLIISDGAYGVRGFDGDPACTDELGSWYRPHIIQWSRFSPPGTSLWFWCTEVGWATVHPELKRHGWDYIQTVTWDKGPGHVAGRFNSSTARRFPVTTEVCVLYQRRFEVKSNDGRLLNAQQWLRHEWRRSGLPMSAANKACGVKNAASRKYLAPDWRWYCPSGDAVAAMAEYCSKNGAQTGAPFFSLDGKSPVTADQWDAMRRKWNHVHGLTNVWRVPQLSGAERLRLSSGPPRAAHPNQKPLELMSRIVEASSDPGDVVWEPFGGLASGSVAAVRAGRFACVAEVDPVFAAAASRRLEAAVASITPDVGSPSQTEC